MEGVGGRTNQLQASLFTRSDIKDNTRVIQHKIPFRNHQKPQFIVIGTFWFQVQLLMLEKVTNSMEQFGRGFKQKFNKFTTLIFSADKSPKGEQSHFEENGVRIPTFGFLQAKCKEYKCPLTDKIPTKPTLAYCCKTYFEKEAIEKHIKEKNNICPTCKGNLPLSRLEKYDNFAREDAIAFYHIERDRYLHSQRGKQEQRTFENLVTSQNPGTEHEKQEKEPAKPSEIDQQKERY